MNLLFTSAGRRSYLIEYFKEALGDRGVIHAANSSLYSTAMEFSDYAIQSPLIHEEAYIPFLKAYCIQHDITAIIPLFDVDLPILAKNQREFNDIGVTIIVSSEEVINRCNDKWKTYIFLKEKGFHTPLTYLSISDVQEAIRLEQLDFPLIVKPRWGMGSVSVYEVENMEELIVLYEKTKRTIHSTYLTFEAQQSIEQSIIIQEKLIGQEYGLDVINDLDGEYQAVIVKKKLSMRSGETDCAETVVNHELVKVGEQLSRSLGHVGNLDVDAFNVKGVPFILEMNARFGGGYPFSHMANANLPEAIIKWLAHEKVEKSLLEADIGIVSVKNLTIIKIGNRNPIPAS